MASPRCLLSCLVLPRVGEGSQGGICRPGIFFSPGSQRRPSFSFARCLFSEEEISWLTCWVHSPWKERGAEFSAPLRTLAQVVPFRPKLSHVRSAQPWVRTSIGTHILSHVPSPVFARLFAHRAPLTDLPNGVLTLVEFMLALVCRGSGFAWFLHVPCFLDVRKNQDAVVVSSSRL
jgi:hypothetical protein